MKTQKMTSLKSKKKAIVKRSSNAEWISINRDSIEKLIYTYLVLNPIKKKNWIYRPMSPKQFAKDIGFAEWTIQNIREKQTASRKTIEKIAIFAKDNGLEGALEKACRAIRKKV